MRRIGTLTLSLVLTGWAPALVRAAAATAPATLPSLTELEKGFRALYADLQQRTVRVIVPVQMSPNLLGEHPLNKWAPLIDPKIRDALTHAAQNQAMGPRVYVEAPRQGSQGGAVQVATQPQQIPPATAEAARVPLSPPTPTLHVEFIGLVLDAHGNVLVPIFIDKAVAHAPLQVSFETGLKTTTAQIVEADPMTALTVVRLAEPAGKPVTFADARPPDGSLIMILTPTRRQARLSIWPGAADETGILCDASGKVCGIARNHHALLTTTFKPIVDQLVTGAPIKRALLGIAIAELPADHPMRAQIPNLGTRPAARVEGFLENSPAARAGVQLGDLIVQLNDDPVEDIATFAAAVANCRGNAALHILRNGQSLTISVPLAQQ
jgi:hypothetical protein